MSFFDRETETASRDHLEAMQWQKLKALLEITFAGNSFYRRKYSADGIESADVRDLSELDKLPLATKLEFQEDQAEHPPFGSNLSESLGRYVQYHQTTGTTGMPLKWLDTAESWQWRARCVAHAMRAAKLTLDDVFMLPFNFGPYTAFWGAYEAAQLLGMLTIPTGGWDTRERLQCLLDNGATALAATPTYARRMAEVAQDQRIDLRSSKLRVIMLAGEPGAMIPAVRDKLQTAWGAKVYEYPGMTEVGTYAFACELSESTRALHGIDSEFIIEVIDPHTGKTTPEGMVGELVITNLGRACSPAIRFRTGDLVKPKRGSCACGRTFSLLEGGILGRSDDMLLIRGVNVFPSAVGNIVEEVLPRGCEYQIASYRRPAGNDALMVRVEIEPGQEHLTEQLTHHLKERLHLRIEVEALARGTLPKFAYKAKRLVKLEK